MRVVIAPDSFKGSLTSVEVATALAAGWSEARPQDEVLLAPLADGGEGTLVAIAAAGGWSWESVSAADPIGRPVAARWLRSAVGDRAVVELAEASGISRLAMAERDPLGASRTLNSGVGTLADRLKFAALATRCATYPVARLLVRRRRDRRHQRRLRRAPGAPEEALHLGRERPLLRG